MAGEHTPGPYRADGPDMFGDYNILHDGGALAIAAVVQNLRDKDEVAANAALFSASSEMLEALECLLDGFPFPHTANEYELVQAGCEPMEARKIAKARAAIAKARGQS